MNYLTGNIKEFPSSISLPQGTLVDLDSSGELVLANGQTIGTVVFDNITFKYSVILSQTFTAPIDTNINIGDTLAISDGKFISDSDGNYRCIQADSSYATGALLSKVGGSPPPVYPVLTIPSTDFTIIGTDTINPNSFVKYQFFSDYVKIFTFVRFTVNEADEHVGFSVLLTKPFNFTVQANMESTIVANSKESYTVNLRLFSADPKIRVEYRYDIPVGISQKTMIGTTDIFIK